MAGGEVSHCLSDEILMCPPTPNHFMPCCMTACDGWCEMHYVSSGCGSILVCMSPSISTGPAQMHGPYLNVECSSPDNDLSIIFLLFFFYWLCFHLKCYKALLSSKNIQWIIEICHLYCYWVVQHSSILRSKGWWCLARVLTNHFRCTYV